MSKVFKVKTMVIAKNEFIALFLKMIQKDLEKHLVEKETESETLIHASEIVVSKLRHIAESN